MHSVNKNKTRQRTRRGLFTALLSARGSMIVIDPKSECAAVVRGKAKNNGGVPVFNPFVVLPPKQVEKSATWFRLSLAAALGDLQRKDGKHPWNRTE